MTKHANTEAGFYKLIEAIEIEQLRLNVADSALTNASDTMIECGYTPTNSHYAPWGDKQAEFWEMAISTAEMILDDPKAYYPELYK
jgi:hypothetical protein